MTKLMMSMIVGATLVLGSSAFAQVPAEKPAAEKPAAEKAAEKLSADSKVSALLANAKAKAVLQKHVPLIVENAPRYPEVLEMSLRELSKIEMAQSAGGLTEEAMKKIEADLKALEGSVAAPAVPSVKP